MTGQKAARQVKRSTVGRQAIAPVTNMNTTMYAKGSFSEHEHCN